MNDHQLGAALRQQVLSDLQRGRGAEGRRLQALAGDLCGEEQIKLLPALRHLMLSAAFASAASQSPPLSDTRLLPRLMQELEEVFNPAICQRMERVVGGLLGQPPKDASSSSSTPISAPNSAPPAAAAMPNAAARIKAARRSAVPAPVTPLQPPATPPLRAPARRGGGSNALLGVLAFLTGGLAVALVGALVLLQKSPPSTVDSPSTPRPRSESPTTAEKPATPPQQPSLPEPEPITAPQPPPANTDQAIASVQGLYAALSGKTYDQARRFFGGAAADQFDPAFFDQFEQVSVSDLQETSQDGSTVTLRGLVTFVYPDGSVQTESRRFSVDTATTPALITASDFGGVVKAR
jgi:serine/threonine-protein kinase